MSIGEALLDGLFCIFVVFAVLIILYILIRLFSAIVALLSKKNRNMQSVSAIVTQENYSAPEISAGELKLYNVDERTAALIMAIVSDESGIPLSELCFKSIKAKD
jgi:uncharacterized membrane protein